MCKTRYSQNRFLYIFLVELGISNVKFYLNFQKNLSDKICIDLNVEFQKQGHFAK